MFVDSVDYKCRKLRFDSRQQLGNIGGLNFSGLIVFLTVAFSHSKKAQIVDAVSSSLSETLFEDWIGHNGSSKKKVVPLSTSEVKSILPP